MLTLNTMFDSHESIFGSEAPRRPISATELQMMEMEINTDLTRAEIDSTRIATVTMQLDQLLNMYNYVKQFGIDRSFLSLYNNDKQLNSMLGMKFPSCESVDCIGTPTSSYSQMFIVAMEDGKEGIFAKIGNGIKWIWEKIKELCTKVWGKIMSWFDKGDTPSRLEKCFQKLKEFVGNEHVQRVGGKLVEAVKPGNIIRNSPGFKLLRFCKKHWLLTCLGIIVAIPVGIITMLGIIVARMFKNVTNIFGNSQNNNPNTPSMEDYPAASAPAEAEVGKSINEITANIKGLDAKLNEACEIEQVNVTANDAIAIVSDTMAIEKAISGTREKLNNAIKKVTDFVKKITSSNNPITSMLVQKAGSIAQEGIQKLIQSLFKSESTARKVCGAMEMAIAALKMWHQ